MAEVDLADLHAVKYEIRTDCFLGVGILNGDILAPSFSINRVDT